MGDVTGNLAQISDSAGEAASQGAQIVVFPELAATGYSFSGAEEVKQSAVSADNTMMDEWRELASGLGIVLVAGYAEVGTDGELYNSAVLITPSGDITNYRKAHLWNAEKTYFSPGGGKPPVVDTPFGRLGLMICFDLEFPEWVRLAALEKADLICAPVNWPLYPRPEHERPTEIVRIQADASVNRVSIAACDRAGADRSQPWLGGSVIVDADGFPLTDLILGTVGTIDAKVDLTASRNKQISERNDVLLDRRPELYQHWGEKLARRRYELR